MSFATSASAFGIKSAGTSTFGSTQPPQGGGLFGNTQPQNAGTSLFGGGQNQQQQGSSVFGNAQSQPPQQQNPLFGSTQNQPQQAHSLFGGQQQQQPHEQNPLFGNTQTQPQQGSSLFGGQQQQQPTQQSQSLFGNTQNQPQQQSTSLFGSQPAQQQSGTGSLFGSTQQPAQQGSSLFGATSTQPQQQQQPSTFGSSLWGTKTNPLMPQAAQPASFGNIGGSTLFNQGQQPQQQQTNSQPPGGAPLFTKSTKFNDLPDNIKKTFEDIDGHIQGRIHIGKELKQRKLAEQATKGQELIRDVHKELENAVSSLRSDSRVTKDLKKKVDQSVQDTIVATRIVDGFRNPQHHLKNHATFPLEFFERITIEMRDRLQWYKSTIEQIERKLSSASSQSQYTPQSISSSLVAQHATFISLANKTAVIDAELQKIKAIYTQLWRAKTGSMRDPFNELDRGSGGDFGLDGLAVQ